MRLGRLPITLSAWLALGSVPVAVAADESLHRRQAKPGKYFVESSFSVHYDGRFAIKRIKDKKTRREALRVLIQTYLATFESIGIETWLMHGSLLGWIDMEHGLFIDITTARYNVTYGEGEGVLVGKDGHLFRDTYLLPLLETTYEGVKAEIPYKYKDFLISEYGKEFLLDKEINNHHFDDDKMEWVPTGEL
ncbi:hypothetical protein HYQ44_010522 [Verticillium longisporum]|nr:hypothetical protein HYQ44_010522 [Verticillium longisporum]